MLNANLLSMLILHTTTVFTSTHRHEDGGSWQAVLSYQYVHTTSDVHTYIHTCVMYFATMLTWNGRFLLAEVSYLQIPAKKNTAITHSRCDVVMKRRLARQSVLQCGNAASAKVLPARARYMPDRRLHQPTFATTTRAHQQEQPKH